MSDHTIRVLTMLGSLGTPLAVGVTVWLALRAERLRLRVRIGWQKEELGLNGPPGLRSERHHILCSITNTSLRAVTVQSVDLVHRDWLGRENAILALGEWDPQLPLELEPGKNCELRILWSSWLKAVAASPKCKGAVVQTPIGRKHVRIDSRVRKHFLQTEPVER